MFKLYELNSKNKSAMRLMLSLFLLFTINMSWAQCNLEEYTRIFNEASALQEKGEFIDAKNGYEAAKIYACGQKEKDAADGKIDALFEQIDHLRFRADSTAEANRRSALTAYANDLAYKSKTALRDDDLNTAFRLAEFAHRYVETDNPNVVQGLADALYYNAHYQSAPLPRQVTLEMYASNINSLAFSADSKRLASGAEDGMIKIWDVASEKTIAAFSDTSDKYLGVSDLVFSPDGNFLAAACYGHIKVWDWRHKKIVQSLPVQEGWGKLDFSPININDTTGGRLLAIGSGNTAIIWAWQKNLRLATFTDSISNVRCIAFSPDGERIATGSTEKSTIIWDISSGQPIRKIKIPTMLRHLSVHNLDFSSDGQLIVTGCSDNVARIWNVNTGDSLSSFYEGAPYDGFSYADCGVRFSLDGKLVTSVSTSGEIKVWNIKRKFFEINLKGTYGKSQVAFSRDGKMIATSSSGGLINILKLENNETSVVIRHLSNVKCIAFSEKDKLYYTENNTLDGFNIVSRNIENNETVDSFDITGDVTDSYWEKGAFSSSGSLFASAYEDKKIRLWDVRKHTLLDSIAEDSAVAIIIVFSKDSKKMAYANRDGRLKIWDIQSRKTLFSYQRKGNSVTAIAFAPDGERLAAGYSDGTIEIWNVQNRTLFTSMAEKDDINSMYSIWSLAYSADGKLLAAGSGPEYFGTAKVWDARNGKLMFKFDKYQGAVLTVAFSPVSKNDPDGVKWLATGSMDGTLKLWDLQQGNLAITFKINLSQIRLISFSPDGKQIFAGTEDDRLIILELHGNGLINRWKATGWSSILKVSKLKQYNLETLLDKHPENEANLIATKEVWQIKSFADLAASQAAGSNILSRVEPHYARAERLYAAALALQDELLIRMDYAKMLRRWAEVYQSDGLTAKATELNTKADSLYKE